MDLGGIITAKLFSNYGHHPKGTLSSLNISSPNPSHMSQRFYTFSFILFLTSLLIDE